MFHLQIQIKLNYLTYHGDMRMNYLILLNGFFRSENVEIVNNGTVIFHGIDVEFNSNPISIFQKSDFGWPV